MAKAIGQEEVDESMYTHHTLSAILSLFCIFIDHIAIIIERCICNKNHISFKLARHFKVR